MITKTVQQPQTILEMSLTDRLFEGCWLTAVVIVPLFFNLYSARIFEADKACLLRSIAMFMVVLWIFEILNKLILSKKPKLQSFFSGQLITPKISGFHPIFWGGLFVLGATSLSTLMSIQPKISLVGSYHRLQGLYTTVSYLVFFFSILLRMRTQKQCDRLLAAIVLVSFPVSMYGIIQHFHLDFLTFPSHVLERSTSTEGNPIFLGGYLILVIPLTLARLKCLWGKMAGNFDRTEALWGMIVCAGSTAIILFSISLMAFANTTLLHWLVVLGLLLLLIPLYVFIPGSRFFRVMKLVLPVFFSLIIINLSLYQIYYAPDNNSYFWATVVVACLFILTMALFGYFSKSDVPLFLRTTSYFLILTAQLICLLLTQSRGPLLALIGALALFFILWGLVQKRVWISYSIICFVLCLFVLIGSINVLNDQNSDRMLFEIPYFSRLTKFVQGSSIQVRRYIWTGVTDLMTQRPCLNHPTSEGGIYYDPLHSVRPCIGYGPDTVYCIFPQVYPAKLGQYDKRKVTDRCHNNLLDVLVMTGGLGVFFHLFLYTAVIYVGLAWLGLCSGYRRKILFFGLWIGGGITGTAIAWSSHHPFLVALGLPGGLLFGLGAYITIFLLSMSDRKSKKSEKKGNGAIYLIAVLSAILGHFIEVQFGIETTATALYFWVYSAIIGISGLRIFNFRSDSYCNSFPQTRKKVYFLRDQFKFWQPSFYHNRTSLFICILILGTLLFEGLNQNSIQSLLSFINPTLKSTISSFEWLGFVVLIGSFWMIGAIANTDFYHQKTENISQQYSYLQIMGIYFLGTFAGTLCIAIALSILQILIMKHIAALPSTFFFYTGFLMIMVISIALSLPGQRPFQEISTMVSRRTPIFFTLALCLFGSSLIAVYFMNIKPIQADINYKYAQTLRKKGELEQAVQILEESSRECFHKPVYWTTTGRYYLDMAVMAPKKDRDRLYEKGEKVIKKTLAEAPYNPQNYVNLATFYHHWALSTKEPDQKRRLEQAWELFRQAAQLSPQNIFILNDWALCLKSAGELSKAEALYEKSLTLNPDYGPTYLRAGDLSLKKSDWLQAIRYYQTATQLMPENAEAYSGLGCAFIRNDNIKKAIHAYRQAIAVFPEGYNDYKNLGIAYELGGLIEKAIEAFQKAIAFAPEKLKPELLCALEGLQAELKKEVPCKGK